MSRRHFVLLPVQAKVIPHLILFFYRRKSSKYDIQAVAGKLVIDTCFTQLLRRADLRVGG
jgi:hypothetical protein